jgi:hypothetical protein
MQGSDQVLSEATRDPTLLQTGCTSLQIMLTGMLNHTAITIVLSAQLRSLIKQVPTIDNPVCPVTAK